MTIATILIQQRAEIGLSVSESATRSGITHSRLQQIENGEGTSPGELSDLMGVYCCGLRVRRQLLALHSQQHRPM